MSANCDSATLNVLRHVIGMRLEKIVACRYPGYLAYSHVIAIFAGGHSIKFDLSEVTIKPKFEVFVVRARQVTPPAESSEWDQIALGDFLLANVFVLRREEWIQGIAGDRAFTTGLHGVEQRFGSIEIDEINREAVIADSGLCLVSARGAELSVDADTFPLVLQLRYEVAASPLPRSSRIAISQSRIAQ